MQPLGPQDPHRIGAFPLRGVLGSGGMGRVYLGLAPTGYTAVKQVLPYLAADRDFLRHFSQELDNQARLPAGVSARLLAADRTAQPPWFATEYIPGVTLHECVYLEDRSLPAHALWLLLRELADRLRAVHSLSMMHRDLKPSNVMLTDAGVTLIDFGVARAADQSAVTKTGVAVGTPAYMAPEQARAERTLTSAVDVFSLGSVLAFAASGRPPFGEGAGHDVFYRIIHQDPDLSAVEAADPALAALVASCLAKDPQDRPSAAELVDFAAANVLPGPVAWPSVTMQRIAVRRAFAAAAPVEELEATEPERQPEPELNADAVQTAPLQSKSAATPVPSPASGPVIGRPERRSRKTLILVLPLVLVLGGTAGTLLAMGKVPWVTNDGSSGNPSAVSGSGGAFASGSSGTSTATSSSSTIPTGSAPATPPSAPATHTATTASTTQTKGTTTIGGGSGSGGSSGGSGGSSGGSGSGGSGSGGGTKTTGPSGPGNDSALVGGSNVKVDNCEGWIDFTNSGAPDFTAVDSAGSPATCDEAATFSLGYGGMAGTPSTTDISASNGAKNSIDTCGGECGYAGSYTITAKICVWNTGDAADKACTTTYTYNSQTNQVTS